MDKMYQHSSTTFIKERLKDCLHNPTDYTTPYHHCTNNLNSWRGPSTPAKKSLSNQGNSPREKGDEAQGETLIWEWLSCHVVYHLGDHVHPLSVCEGVNTIANTGIKMTPWVQHRWSSQQQQNTWSWHLPGGFLLEKALRQKVIIVVSELSGIIHCEDKHIIKPRQRGRGRYSYYHPLEIYALQGWVLWVSGLNKSDEAEWA